MKRIGILFGQERSFPLALVERINRAGAEVVAEPVHDRRGRASTARGATT